MAHGEPAPGLTLPATESPTIEDRAHPRYDAPPGVSCRVTTVTRGELYAAAVTNVSRGGIHLLTEMPLSPGTCVMIELRSRSGLFTRVALTHVIHVAQGDDGRFCLGGEFLEPLGPDELRLFLA